MGQLVDVNLQYWTRSMEKQVEYRAATVLSTPMYRSLLERFGVSIFRRSSIFHGLDQFLRENEIRGDRCFEIGTWNGLTAAVLSQYFKEVVTVDIVHNKHKHKVLDHLGIKNVRCIDIADNSEKAQIAKDIDFDTAFLDGNHAEDTENDFDMVKHCGRVLFHEVWAFQSPVWELVHSLPQISVRYGGACFAFWDTDFRHE